MIIRTKAFPRIGLVGNPSDGYFGKTIAFTFLNFSATVTLYETPELEILPNRRDHSTFSSLTHLVEDVGHFGYYGGIRLLKAALKTFHDYAMLQGWALDDRNFTIRYESDIPHLVGLAGSSAIISACVRSLMAFYDVTIPLPELANLMLSVERKELGISAGLQDRVAQAYQGLVYMDFDKERMEKDGHGRYERLDPALMPPLYMAYRQDLSEGSEVFHSTLRSRFDSGNRDVIEAMTYLGTLTEQVKESLEEGDHEQISRLLDANFDCRNRISEISQENREMVDAARAVGASAKFTGSGGAIVGVYTDDAMFTRLGEKLEPQGVRVIKPDLAPEV